ncbi:hypothetical protein Pint_33080 [Pistacia integerrima]|uniref:Uncharacterized protein n=1 Tax=Pistacia integerrima TaxID=434235 RepID=A0ACC0X7D9_9ROSI|nr:hypothetical protein Pint_33080 [Pistacia integerrima]
MQLKCNYKCQASALSDPVSRSCLFTLFIAVSLICGAYFIGNAAKDHKERIMRWGVINSMWKANSNACKNQCRPPGTEALPQGIVAKTSNLEMRPLWSSTMKLVCEAIFGF